VKTVNNDFHSYFARTRAGIQFALFRRGLLTMPPGTVNAFIRSSDKHRTADVQLLAFPMSYDQPGDPPHKAPGFSVNVVLLRPKSRGSIQLKSGEASAAPAIRFGLMSHPDDRDQLVAGLRRLRTIVNSPALTRYRVSEIRPGPQFESDEALHERLEELAETSCHAVGTCKMGIDDTAVVDPRLRVKGVSGLRVVDASIMPTLVSGNTNAPAIMIGEKGAAMILEDAARS
jgi:choline dehydrogenase-like flavoprotein